MIKAEIKEKVDSMPQNERIGLATYLKMKELAEDPEFRREADKRLKEMKNGSALSGSDLKELDGFMRHRGL
jgi:hypothetical protein